MKIQSAINAVRESETKLLVALYNQATGKEIKKFQDRKTAESRVIGVLKTMSEKELTEAVTAMLSKLDRDDRAGERRTEERRTEDRRAQERRSQGRREEEIANVDPTQDGAQCPHCHIDLSNGYIMDGDDAGNAGTIKLSERQFECHACGGEFGPAITPDREKDHNRSVAIAKSWQDPEVKRSRSQRHAVRVDGEEYRSVKAAFEALGLPLKEHIKFRMRLKEEEEMQAYGFYWEVIER